MLNIFEQNKCYLSLSTFRWEMLKTRLFGSLNKTQNCSETQAHKQEASIWCVFMITVRRLWPDGRDATLDKLQSHFCSLGRFSMKSNLESARNFPSIHIHISTYPHMPTESCCWLCCLLSGSNSLKWKSFTFSDQLEYLPSAHHRACVDLEGSPESMRFTLHMKQKML